MSSKAIYFCVYRITNILTGKHYYGYKSSSIHPSKVIGIKYFSSLTGKDGKEFILDQKTNPRNYKYKIVKIFDNKTDAMALEVKLHAKFDVKRHPKFYNKSNQTSVGFDVTGKFCVKDSNGDIFLVNSDDPGYISGKYVGLAAGQTVVKDKDGNIFRVNMDDPRWISGELLSYNGSEKTLETKLNLYGNSNYCNSAQIENTMMEKYGESNAMRVPEFFEKQQISYNSTMNAMYGVNYGLQSPEIRIKCMETWKITGRNKEEKHPLARKIQIKTPTGQIYNAHGNFKKICNEILKPIYNISYDGLRNILKGKPPRNKYENWEVIYTDI
jgi:hypothetical protein